MSKVFFPISLWIAFGTCALLAQAPSKIPSIHAEAVPAITFLDAEAAAAAIADDGAEPYFCRLHAAEIAVKCGVKKEGADLDTLRKEARKAFQSKVLSFTEDEKEVIRWILVEIEPRLIQTYPLFGRTPWRFIKVTEDLEGGLPHTRGGSIVLSPLVLQGAVGAWKAGHREALRHFIGELLVHEQTHVLQRAHPDLFAKEISEVFQFHRTTRIETHPWLVARSLVNPDATDTGWIYAITEGGAKRWIWPLVVLASDDLSQRMPRDFRLVGVYLQEQADGFKVQVDEKGAVQWKLLSEIEPYAKAFPNAGEIYHPYEISADLCAQFFTVENLLPEEAKAKYRAALQPWAKVRDWMKANLK